MGLGSYVIVGALLGLIAGLLARRSARGILLDVALGIVGSLVGGGIGRIAGWRGVIHAFNYRSFILAVVCAIVLLAVVELVFFQRRRTRGSYSS